MADSEKDLEMMASTVDHYFKGMYNGDVERLKKAFHPQAQVIGHFQGTLLFNSLEQFLDVVDKAPVPAESGEEYDMRIVSMDVTGISGIVKVADLYMGLRFTDYLSMLKVENEWVIVNKTYFHE